MADLGFAIVTEELPTNTFELLAANKYPVILGNTTLLPTNKTKAAMKISNIESYEEYRKLNPKASGYLYLEMDIQEGQYAGRKLFHQLNLINDSEQAANIAAAELRKILEAMSVKGFSGKTEELHGKRMTVDVTVIPAKPYLDPASGQQKPGFAQNKCVGFYPYAAVTASAATQTAVSGGKGPWSR